MGVTPVRVRHGRGVFYVTEHCKERMTQRKIGMKEIKTTVRSGVFVTERKGVLKIIGNDIHLVVEEDTRRIYTVYRPYNME